MFKRYKDTNYFVSDTGKIYRDHNGVKKYLNGTEERKYKRIRVEINGKKVILARMVWETFKGEIPKGYVVTHKDGYSRHNQISNLVIKPNCEHTKSNAKKHRVYIDLDHKKLYQSSYKLADALGVTRPVVNNICEGRTKPTHNIAYYCRATNRAFRGNWDKYMEKYKDE